MSKRLTSNDNSVNNNVKCFTFKRNRSVNQENKKYYNQHHLNRLIEFKVVLLNPYQLLLPYHLWKCKYAYKSS